MRKLPDWVWTAFCVTAPFVCAISIWQVVNPFLPLPAAVILYGVAFFCLTAFCIWIPKNLVRSFRTAVAHLRERFRMVELFFTNHLLRIIVLAVPGTALGILFAIFNGFLGIRYDSPWNGTLAGYFLVLTGLRFMVFHGFRRRNGEDFHQRELRIYTTCGMLLAILSITLSAAVILLIYGNAGKNYPGFLVYAMAAYTCYKMYASIRGMVTARRQESLLLIAQRNIGHADALMSLLCLQTGLLNAFGGGNVEYAGRMNGITGGLVALITLIMGLNMMFGGQKRRKEYDSDSCGGR